VVYCAGWAWPGNLERMTWVLVVSAWSPFEIKQPRACLMYHAFVGVVDLLLNLTLYVTAKQVQHSKSCMAYQHEAVIDAGQEGEWSGAA